MRSVLMALAVAFVSVWACGQTERVQGTPEQEGKGGAGMTLTISSPAFRDGETIPTRYTADGPDLSPPLVVSGVPEGTASLALIVDDPDAPMGTWVHWVVWNIPPGAPNFPEGKVPEGAMEGTNSWGRRGWGGPSPPSGTHRYFFKLYALDSTLDLSPRAGKQELLRAMEGHLLGTAELMGTYSR